MKSKFIILISSLIMFFGISQIGNSYSYSYGNKKGKKLATLYTYSETEAFKKAGKSHKWLYKSNNLHEMKIKIYEDGVNLKLEDVELRDTGNDSVRYVRVRTLFDEKTEKNKVYSFSSIIPEGLAAHSLTLRYKGREIKYLLDWGLIIVTDEETGEPVDELIELDFYSEDKGFGFLK